MNMVRPRQRFAPPAYSYASPYVLRDYAFIADGRRGALIDPSGDIAWLCFPTWSDPAVFAGLLGGAGIFRVAPIGRRVHGGYYEDGTLIWRQRWITEGGVVECREALACPGETNRCMVLRRLTAVEGDALVRVVLEAASDYGRTRGSNWRLDPGGWVSEAGGILARLSGCADAIPLSGKDAPGLEFSLRVASGSSLDLLLTLQNSSGSDATKAGVGELWDQTEAAWRAAVPPCRDMPADRDVRLSLAVLRGMTTPEGATVAAATTSLPERAEAGRNYDYRYAWVRDTCYIGHAGAAVDGGEDILLNAVQWVTQRILADGPETMPAYSVDGRPVPEPEHLGLPGYPGGSDIVGNQVRRQFQLDLFGEALLLFALAARRGLLDADGWRAVEVAMHVIEGNAERPECGIWEIEPRQWTHSRLICVAGLKAVAAEDASSRWQTHGLGLADQLLSRAERTSLHTSGRWQRAPGDEGVDASLLLAEIRGTLEPDDPRSKATRAAILSDLCEDEYLYRFAHPGQTLGEAEGAFLISGFWMSLAQLGAGDTLQGGQWFERTRGSCGGSGLFSEEYDVAQRQLRGNIPQAFVHALLVECAGRLRDV